MIVLATDDASWCRTNLGRYYNNNNNNNDTRIYFTADYSQSTTDPVSFDLAVIASTDHTVMLYGTFAFWMTFLAGGEVFLPIDYRRAKQRAPLAWQIVLANASRYHYLTWQ